MWQSESYSWFLSIPASARVNVNFRTGEKKNLPTGKSENKKFTPEVRVDQAVRPLPPKTLRILVGLVLKLTSMCIMIYNVRKVWTVGFVLIMFLSNSLKECVSRICERMSLSEIVSEIERVIHFREVTSYR